MRISIYPSKGEQGVTKPTRKQKLDWLREFRKTSQVDTDFKVSNSGGDTLTECRMRTLCLIIATLNTNATGDTPVIAINNFVALTRRLQEQLKEVVRHYSHDVIINQFHEMVESVLEKSKVDASIKDIKVPSEHFNHFTQIARNEQEAKLLEEKEAKLLEEWDVVQISQLEPGWICVGNDEDPE